MSVVEMQSCLARLYVSSTFRAALRQDAQAALADYDLTGDESSAVEAIDPRMLERFAAMLVSKRRKRFERAYAASFALHGAALEPVLCRFLDEIHTAYSTTTSDQDTLAFGRFAEDTFADHERYIDWAGDLVRFERLSWDAAFVQPETSVSDAAAEDPPIPALTEVPALRPGVVIGDFRYDVVDLDATLRAGGAVPDATPVVNSIVFRPGHNKDGQRMLRVNGPTALVLRRCDGARTVDEIIRAVESELRAADLSDSIRDTISRLQGLRVLSVTVRRTGP